MIITSTPKHRHLPPPKTKAHIRWMIEAFYRLLFCKGLFVGEQKEQRRERGTKHSDRNSSGRALSVKEMLRKRAGGSMLAERGLG